jgi:hypothetical protein
MPDPITSRTDDSYRRLISEDDDDAICRQDPLVSRDGAAPIDDADASVTPAHPAPNGVSTFQADARASRSDLYVGASALKGHDPRGIDVEVFSVSAHAGDHEIAAQGAMARMGTTIQDHLTVGGEVFTAQARAGTENSDGSTGFGYGAGYAIAGAEATVSYSGYSLTGGASFGVAYGVSSGIRDADHDGKPELCARVDFGVGALGACIEKAW